MPIDLHAHSTASDGSDSPAMLASRAAEAHLSALALTDHDTVAGVEPFMQACALCGVEGIAGVEISALHILRGTIPLGVHILGYFFDGVSDGFEEALSCMMEAREERNLAMITKLQRLGIAIELEDVSALAQGDVVGRVHMAQALMAAGHCRSINEAFSRYLGPGGKAYVPKERLNPQQAIDLIRSHQGYAVLAHPGTLPLRGHSEYYPFIENLVSKGLGGVEAHYPFHSPSQRTLFCRIARSLQVVVTGGSDYHGQNRPGIELGRGDGSLQLEYAMLEQMRQWYREHQ
ncbi:PHP domain-containing protein [Desulfurispirillum indicum]|uniref:PHP domain-containing protein n=1 Tax=Desulfurispirillum indicum TaxID=936456 RepID=UPI001CF9D35B|nr:PHP domain-containing protein [Desulfurispirillum indicum]UCZ55678.1 PHP domain-containing protein [Desulfurispirillum indicum]